MQVPCVRVPERQEGDLAVSLHRPSPTDGVQIALASRSSGDEYFVSGFATAGDRVHLKLPEAGAGRTDGS